MIHSSSERNQSFLFYKSISHTIVESIYDHHLEKISTDEETENGNNKYHLSYVFHDKTYENDFIMNDNTFLNKNGWSPMFYLYFYNISKRFNRFKTHDYFMKTYAFYETQSNIIQQI